MGSEIVEIIHIIEDSISLEHGCPIFDPLDGSDLEPGTYKITYAEGSVVEIADIECIA